MTNVSEACAIVSLFSKAVPNWISTTSTHILNSRMTMRRRVVGVYVSATG
jgi:hypothetical protein